MSSPFPYKYQPSSGLSSSLLMKTSCLRLKLVELNLFASFNADDQRITYVSGMTPNYNKSPNYIMCRSIFTAATVKFQESLSTGQGQQMDRCSVES